MDRKYLEFWGNIFLQAARSQEQLEELNRFAKEGFTMAQAQMSLFRKLYGLEDSAESVMAKGGWWQKSFADFKDSYRQFLELLGAVPREEYDELESRYEILKQELDEKKKKGGPAVAGDIEQVQGELARGVQELIVKQGEQFKELMNAYSRMPVNKRNRKTNK